MCQQSGSHVVSYLSRRAQSIVTWGTIIRTTGSSVLLAYEVNGNGGSAAH